MAKLNKNEIKLQIKNLFLVIIGTSILGFGVGIFILPFNLVTGGVPSVAIILKSIIPLNISEGVYITIVTWILFFIGLFILGRGFALKTLASSIVYPIVVNLSSLLVSPNVLNGFFYLQGYEMSQLSLLLGAVFGGALTGVGCALTFIGGGSTGGLDIVALSISKYIKKANSSLIIFLTDAALIILGMFVLNDFILTLLGISSAFVCAIVIDRLFVGESKVFVAQIISDKYEEINKIVIEKLNRTTTILDATGGYSKSAKKMIYVSFTMNQYSLLLSQISKIDPRAFVTIHRVHEINGNGFTSDDDNDLKKEK